MDKTPQQLATEILSLAGELKDRLERFDRVSKFLRRDENAEIDWGNDFDLIDAINAFADSLDSKG